MNTASFSVRFTYSCRQWKAFSEQNDTQKRIAALLLEKPQSFARVLFMMMVSAAAMCIVLFRTAGAAVRTTDTLFSAFFRFINIERSGGNNNHKDCDHNVVDHQDFAPLSAYSRFRSFSVFMHR